MQSTTLLSFRICGGPQRSSHQTWYRNPFNATFSSAPDLNLGGLARFQGFMVLLQVPSSIPVCGPHNLWTAFLCPSAACLALGQPFLLHECLLHILLSTFQQIKAPGSPGDFLSNPHLYLTILSVYLQTLGRRRLSTRAPRHLYVEMLGV